MQISAKAIHIPMSLRHTYPNPPDEKADGTLILTSFSLEQKAKNINLSAIAALISYIFTSHISVR